MTFHWPSDEGWPYPDKAGPDLVDPDAVNDDEILSVVSDSHLLDRLSPLERQVIGAHYGLFGQPVRSMKQLHVDLGLPRAELKGALGAGLAKLRTELSS